MVEDSKPASIFSDFQQHLDEEQDIKEEIRTVVRDIEQKTREILTVLQSVHQPNGIQDIPNICSKAQTMLQQIQGKFIILAEKVPKDQYYRFHDHWKFVMQRLCFMVALMIYLESEKLVTREECAALIGVHVRREDGFHLDLDDFLMGLLQLASELSRLSVNAVTAGDYGRPMKIAKFVGELDSGFRLLNLKNDSLRKRFDGLKYDLKKVEEIVYDVTIRGLKPEQSEHKE